LAIDFAAKWEVFFEKDEHRLRPGKQPFFLGRGRWRVFIEGEPARLALAHLAEHGAHALLGLTSLTFLAALLAFEPLHRCQKPQRFWLAI
jgi:hypothetical protein